MHQAADENSLFSYWIVAVYDPAIDMFTDVFKSYGQNIAQEKLMEYLVIKTDRDMQISTQKVIANELNEAFLL